MIKKILAQDKSLISNSLALIYSALTRKRKMIKRNVGSFDYLSAKELPNKNGNFFILGSGASVNELTAEQFQEIKEGYSIGLNLWVLHDFVPDAYSFEFIGGDASKKLHVIERKLSELGKVGHLPILLFKSSLLLDGGHSQIKIPKNMESKVRLYSTARLPFWNESGMSKVLSKVLSQTWLSRLPKGIIYEKKASIERLTYLAIMAGFKNIIYVGVDLNSTKYFWDEFPEYFQRYGLTSLESGQPKGTTHLTEISSNNVPVSKIIETINEISYTIKIPRFRLWATHKSSRLADFLPLFPWESKAKMQ